MSTPSSLGFLVTLILVGDDYTLKIQKDKDKQTQKNREREKVYQGMEQFCRRKC